MWFASVFTTFTSIRFFPSATSRVTSKRQRPAILIPAG